MVHRFRGVTVREGVLLRGPAGWAEFAPFRDYADAAVRALAAGGDRVGDAPLAGTRVATRVPVNVIVPVIDPPRAAELVAASGCRTAKVKVADPGLDLAADLARVAAVRGALGPDGRIRVDANGAWTVAEAVDAIAGLDEAAGGLEYVEQPCRTLAELAQVRAQVRLTIAADESIRRADDPAAVRAGRRRGCGHRQGGPARRGAGRAGPRRGRRACRRWCPPRWTARSGWPPGLPWPPRCPSCRTRAGWAPGVLLAADVCADPPRPIGGFLDVRARAPDPDLIDRVAADADRTAYWRDRLRRVAILTQGRT